MSPVFLCMFSACSDKIRRLVMANDISSDFNLGPCNFIPGYCVCLFFCHYNVLKQATSW